MKKLYQKVPNLFEILSMIFLAGILLAVVLQVFFRYVAQLTVPWTEEVARYLGIWMVFMGAAVAVAHEAHIKITFFLERLPDGVRKIFNLSIDGVMFLFTLIVFLGSIQLIRLNWAQEAVTFPMSVGVLYLAIAISSGFILIFLTVLMGTKLRTYFN